MKEKENIFSTETMPGINNRVKILIDKHTNGSVKRFAEYIQLSNSQKLNRIFNIDKRNNTYPEPSIDIVISIANMFPSINLRWLLIGEGDIEESHGDNEEVLNSSSFNKLILSLSDKDTEIRDLYSRIIDLTSEVERLKAQLDRERESAGVARSSIADAG